LLHQYNYYFPEQSDFSREHHHARFQQLYLPLLSIKGVNIIFVNFKGTENYIYEMQTILGANGQIAEE
jgi:hypothetical protein